MDIKLAEYEYDFWNFVDYVPAFLVGVVFGATITYSFLMISLLVV